MNEGHVFLERKGMKELDALEEISAKDKGWQEKELTVTDREIRRKRQRGGGEQIDREKGSL